MIAISHNYYSYVNFVFSVTTKKLALHTHGENNNESIALIQQEKRLASNKNIETQEDTIQQEKNNRESNRSKDIG